MKQTNVFLTDMLDMELQESKNDLIWRAFKPLSAKEVDGAIVLDIPFKAQGKDSSTLHPANYFHSDEDKGVKIFQLIIRAYGDSIIRASISFEGTPLKDVQNVIIDWHDSLKQIPLRVVFNEEWEIFDENGRKRMSIQMKDIPIKEWRTLDFEDKSLESFNAIIYPAGKTAVQFNGSDTFFRSHMESISLAYVARGETPIKSVFSILANGNEKFVGTGERFSKMDLSGKTLLLENEDAMGVNSRRAYKNVPFYISSNGYGLLMLTSAHIRLSFADISNRAVQAAVEDNNLDLFFIGGNVESINYDYRRITGFPKMLPLWSFGTWMSRMTYFSAQETLEIAQKLRDEKMPCDVIHLDTGWFEKDWKCEWQFSKERFPNPKEYLKDMKDLGYRVTLWQLPSVAKDTLHYETAIKKGYLAQVSETDKSVSNFSEVEYGGDIDFSNPEAYEWYQGLLENLLNMGVAAIKTDFGEKINMSAQYKNIPAAMLHNLYTLLYQKSAFEITEKVNGDGIIWARGAWAGCQRYPLHWGGDASSTWEGMASTIRGGLHLGLSGFAFWSHDIPGFYGSPNFNSSWPDDDLYVRWTQLGVFSSHMRYHGSTPREPYLYPKIAPIIRKWLNLRYALIPYIYEESQKAVKTGYPIFRALAFHHQEDMHSWHVDDQYYFGDHFLIAPVLNSEGIRDVYLPEGEWVDFWTGEKICGPLVLKNVSSELSEMPVYVKLNSKIKMYPDIVQSTDEMDLEKAVEIVFDDTFKGVVLR